MHSGIQRYREAIGVGGVKPGLNFGEDRKKGEKAMSEANLTEQGIDPETGKTVLIVEDDADIAEALTAQT
jgi:hypothetical protein